MTCNIIQFLLQHIKAHSCPHCDYKCKILYNLHKHIRARHHIQVETLSSLRKKAIETGKGYPNFIYKGQLAGLEPMDRNSLLADVPLGQTNEPTHTVTGQINEPICTVTSNNDQLSEIPHKPIHLLADVASEQYTLTDTTSMTHIYPPVTLNLLSSEHGNVMNINSGTAGHSATLDLTGVSVFKTTN